MRAKAGQRRGKAQTRVAVSLAGRVAIRADGTVVGEERFPGRQGRLIFAYLASEAGRPIPRDELAEALWDGNPPVTWEKGLTVIVSKLRALLEECGVDGTKALTSAFGCYHLDLPEGSSIDVVEARQATADSSSSSADLAKAAEVAAGPFLPGDEGPWVDLQRRELAGVRVRALGRLADASLEAGDHAEAARLAQQVVELEPYRESGHRRLMQAHTVAGNRAEGLRAYERCRRFLADELGAYPSPETESVYKELLAAPTAQVESAPPTRTPPVEKVPARRRGSRRGSAAVALGAAVAAVGTAVLVGVAVSGEEEGVQALASKRCSPIDYGGSGKPDVLIAADLPLQRGVLSLSRPMADALTLALQRHDYRAGPFNVALQVCDDATPDSPLFSEVACADNADAFARNASVVGVVGPFASGCASIEIPKLNQAPDGPLAIVSPSNTLVELTRSGPDPAKGAGLYYPTGQRNYARVIAPDDAQAAASAIVARKLGVRRVYVLDDAGDYGVAMASVFKRTVRKLRVAVVGGASWDPAATTYGPLVAKIAEARADGVFVAGASSENGIALVNDLRESLGTDVQLMAPDGFDPRDTLTAVGRAAEGMTMSRAGIPNERLGAAGREFVAAFSKRFGSPPTGYAVHAAQALDVLLDAIARSDGTRASVSRKLFSTRISNGILGTFWITSTGDTTLNVVTIFRIVQGRVTTYDTVSVPEGLLGTT